MFSKKKSLARIATLRNKREKAKKRAAAATADSGSREMLGNNNSDDDDDDLDIDADGFVGSAVKRMSWQGDLLLPLPLLATQHNSHSTPNLANGSDRDGGGAATGLPPIHNANSSTSVATMTDANHLAPEDTPKKDKEGRRRRRF